MKKLFKFETRFDGEILLNKDFVVSVVRENERIDRVFGGGPNGGDIPERIETITVITMSTGDRYVSRTDYQEVVARITSPED